jgi:hypothetical protein
MELEYREPMGTIDMVYEATGPSRLYFSVSILSKTLKIKGKASYINIRRVLCNKKRIGIQLILWRACILILRLPILHT